ncbi:MAG: hypothetical protein HFI37_07585, partial [Lachnospiraceae bacterium]|nr:hypothetical protein [Lachnospiraceae bacterium]
MKQKKKSLFKTALTLLLLFAMLSDTIFLQAETGKTSAKEDALSAQEATPNDQTTDNVTKVEHSSTGQEETGSTETEDVNTPVMDSTDNIDANTPRTDGDTENATVSDTKNVDESTDTDIQTNAPKQEPTESVQNNGTDAPATGLVLLDNNYVLYIDHTQITATGWYEISNEKFYVDNNGHVTYKMEATNGIWKLYKYNLRTTTWEIQKNLWETVLTKQYFFNTYGICTQIYDTATKQLLVNDNVKMVPAKNMVFPLSDHKVYYFDSYGILQTTQGWKNISSAELYYVGNNGSVTFKMISVNGIWKFYHYQYGSQTWEIQKNVWKIVNEKEYYFNSNGTCTRIYDTRTKKCQKYSSGKMVSVKNEICTLRNGKLYYFNSKGIRITKQGWKTISSNYYIQVGKNGYVISRMKKTKNIWKFYNYNYRLQTWEIQKNVWKIVDKKEYYFNSKGKCTKIYNTRTKKCQKYSSGKMVSVKNEIFTLRNEKLYYFNSKGIRITKNGWKTISGKYYVQVSKKGYVTARMKKTKNIWKFYNYNYRAKKWQIQKKVWKTVNKKKYYFNAKGSCTRIYNTATKKCYDCKNGKTTLAKNSIRNICGKEYYFGSKGVKVHSAGLYLTSSGKLI